MTRVAVLGAGFQGVCAALELAARGVDVDLYDRRNTCITEAGGHNEGKWTRANTRWLRCMRSRSPTVSAGPRDG
ncbi:MAG: FAD-dependent oxidoreductase [Vicinamibacterales bacterium]